MKNWILFSLVWVFPVIFGAVQSRGAGGTDLYPTGALVVGADGSYQFLKVEPGYRFTNISGFPSRAAEYDSLLTSPGGTVNWTQVDPVRHISSNISGEITSRDEYDLREKLQAGKDKSFTLDMSFRSFVRNIDHLLFGTNLDPAGTLRTDDIAGNSVFGVKRTINDINARYRAPGSPLTLFVKGSWSIRTGMTDLHSFDMGTASCNSCHAFSRYRNVNNITGRISGGAEFKSANSVVTYKHTYSSFNDNAGNPSDLYGQFVDDGGHNLYPGVPNTSTGVYVNNVWPDHHTQGDSLSLHAAPADSLTFDGNAAYSRTESAFADVNPTLNINSLNRQNLFDADAALNWQPTDRLNASVDFQQHDLINDFTPSDYPLFGNPSLHRYQIEPKIKYRASKMVDFEAHYRREDIRRSGSALWPSVYSPDSGAGMSTDPAVVPFYPIVVAHTFSNLVGASARLRGGETWSLKSGYDWITTDAPGYLTDPKTTSRWLAGAFYAPQSWVAIGDDFNLSRERRFDAMQQRLNTFYTNTLYVTLLPVPDWSMQLNYGYSSDDLVTNVLYGNDSGIGLLPDYQAPYTAFNRSYGVSATGSLFKKKLVLKGNFNYISSKSGFDVNPAAQSLLASCASGGAPCSDSTNFATAFSAVRVSQVKGGAAMTYRWPHDLAGSIGFQYAGYRDRTHPELNGIFRIYNVAVAKTF